MRQASRNRRAWVKNVMIIFLVIMLLLTFFSNTILNSSLPEVAYQYPSSGSISSKIRGTGTVSSNEIYSVTINEERKVKAVAIQVGDEVVAGQNIILLDETESAELAAARQTLEALETAYQRKLLELSFSSADSSSSLELQKLQAALQSALEEQTTATQDAAAVTAAEAEIAAIQVSITVAESNFAAEKAALAAAQTDYDNAVAAQAQASTNLSYYEGVNADASYTSVVQAYETAQAEYQALQETAQTLAQELEALESAQSEWETLSEASTSLTELQATLSQAQADLATVTAAVAATNTSSISVNDTICYFYYDATAQTYQAKIIYIYYSTQAELASYLEELEALLEAYNQDNSSLADYDVDVNDVASSVATLQAALSNGSYAGTEKVTVNSRSYSLNGMSSSELSDLGESLESWISTLERRVSRAQSAYEQAAAQYEQSMEQADASAYSSVSAAIRAKTAELEENTKALAAKEQELAELLQTISDPAFSAAYQALLDANALVNSTNTALYYAQVDYNAAYAASGLEDLQEALAEAKAELAGLSVSMDSATAKQAVLSAQQAIEEYYASLESAELAAELAAALEDFDLQQDQAEIAAAEAEVAELEANTSQQIITAEYGGVVTAMYVGAGSYTTAGEPMVVIERADNGYSLSFSVTAEQAAKVKLGDQAELVNQYSTNITAILSNITADSSDPTAKLLVFSLSGSDVVAGQSLTLSIGEKSSSYDLIIPNSAIRTDSAGKFVLVISSKSSPLGNRYIAKRVDIEVLASDDNNSAIRGDLSSGDAVITTSSTPIESGTQVRLAE